MAEEVYHKPNRLFIFKTEEHSSIEEIIDFITTNVPEIKERYFTIKNKKNIATYCHTPKIKLEGKKIFLERLEVQQVTPSKFQVSVEYRKRLFRPFLLMFVLMGLVAGILPGLIIFALAHESEGQKGLYVQPALERFEGLVGDDEHIKLVNRNS